MPLLESLKVKLAMDLIKWLGSQAYNYFEGSDKNDYENELQTIIGNSTETYKQKYGGVTKSGKTHFCDSEIIILELLKFRLSKNPNADDVNKAIQSDTRVEIPSQDEMNNFLEIFSENIKNSTKLIKFNIENNYKEEIFNISAQLNAVAMAITELKNEGPLELIEEWNKRLDEVTNNIQKFKPQSAFDILERLEARIAEKGISINDTMKGKIFYLKAVCLNELQLNDIEKKSAEHFIAAFKYCPENIEFKANAGLSYLILKDFSKAEKIANEIIEKDEFHSGAWALKCFLKEQEFRTFLSEVPEHVKNKREFKAHVGYWLVNKGYVKTVAELDDLGFNFEITDEAEPLTITSKNKWYWTTIVTYLINKLYELNPVLRSSGFDPEIGEDKNFKYAHTILKKITKAVEGSEIEELHAWYKFQSLYMDYVISQNKNSVHFLETTLDKIKKKYSLEILQIAQVYNSLGSQSDTTKAIKVIKDFGEENNEILGLINSYNYLHVKNPNESKESFKKYLSLHKDVDDRVFYNAVQYLNALRPHSIDAVNEIKAEMNGKIFTPLALKDLFEILTDFSIEPVKTDIALLEKIKTELDGCNENVRFQVAMAFYFNEKYDEVVGYLRDKVNKSKASSELKLYCQALRQGSGDKLELLSILENWRKTQPLDYSLIRTELHIREVQRKWDTFVEIAKEALVAFPGDETLTYALFLGYDNLVDTEGVKNNLSLIENKEFSDERFGIAISGVVLRAGFASEAIELLYKIASKKNNIQARSSYMASLVNYPQDIFKDFASVDIGTYVEYECEGKTEILLVDQECANTEVGKALLNKTVGETAIVGSTTLSGKQIMVKVLRVMDKYAALLREILKSAENPLSGLKLEVLKFEGTDVDSINKAFIENFGAMGSLQKEFKDKEFEKYYNGNSSFTEIASAVFDKSRFDAYFHLTSPIGKRFMAISPSISNKHLLNEESRFVLDVTSVCLFFQLSKEVGITFKHKFIISASLRRELVALITETKMNPEAKLSVNITVEGVTPHFYQDGFKEGRLKFLDEILKWVDDNCEIDQVDEKLNFVLNMETKSQNQDDFIYDYIDNRLLADRPNHFLLTNDVFYYRHLGAGTGNVISPELYLEKFQIEKNPEYTSFMLKGNYVGININLEVLQEEFLNMISGKENRFPICLANFGYSWNPNLEHAKVIARFLKWLYLSNSILEERKNQTAHTLFLSSIRHAPPQFGMTLHAEIQKEFSLLPTWMYKIQTILLTSLKMISSTNG